LRPMPQSTPQSPLKIAALVSGGGTTLQNLLDVIEAGALDAKVELVVGSRPGLVGLQRAAAAGLTHVVVDRREFANCAEFSQRVFPLCDGVGVDLVCLAGWLCLLDVPDRYLGRAMNIHPALLPGFGGKGMYGRRVHHAVLEYGCKVSGCTVHFVDNTYDTGPIILQRPCPVLDDDTPEMLAARVFEEEKAAYPQAIRLFQQGRLRVEGRRVRVLPEAGSVNT
jgi:phosphoribosylglycinamide formyltransferase-1